MSIQTAIYGTDELKMNGNGAHLRFFHVVDGKWAIFTYEGDYVETVDYATARPLITLPEARAEYLRQLEEGQQ